MRFYFCDAMKYVIIIPTYNERGNISLLIPEIFQILPASRIFVVDDSSPDGTAEAVRFMQKEFPNLSLLVRERKEGLGMAYLHAMEETLKDNSVEKIIIMDADFSHNPEYLPDMIKESEYFDVIIGSRYVKGGGVVGWELWRRVLSKFASMYCRSITRMPIYDFTGGFCVIGSDKLKGLDFSKIDASGYAFLIEFKYFLWKLGATFKEIPIVFRNRRLGESKFSSGILMEGVLAPWKIIFKK